MPRPAPRRFRPSLAFAALLVASSVARAETTSYPAERLRSTLNADGVIGVESGTLLPHLQLNVSGWVGYARAPITISSVKTGERLGALLENRAGASVLASVGLFGKAELGLELPLVLYQSRPSEIPGATAVPLPALAVGGLGDLRFVPKVGLVQSAPDAAGALFDLALAVGITAPSGGGHDYKGEAGATFAPELAASLRMGTLRFAGNLGAQFRGTQQVLNQVIESEITAGAGAAWRFGEETPTSAHPFELAGSLSGAFSAKHPFAFENQDPLEARLAFGYDLPVGATVGVGGGVGVNRGWGTPDWRAFATLRWPSPAKPLPPPPPPPAFELPPPPPDTDLDGIPDDADRCVNEPEDKDQFEDADGCPEPDNDKDGILDAADKCPLEAEDADGFEDADGCPEPDNDKDGILDAADKCPLEAEDADGFEDQDGCAEPDNDKDGVLDAADKCPITAGIAENAGCPDVDTDGDAIVDRLDRCPAEKGVPENHGCPDKDSDSDTVVDRLDNCPDEAGDPANNGCKKKQLVVIRTGQLEILEAVYFDTGKDVIQPRSYPLLDNVAAVLKAHPELKKVEVEGHTDNQGRPDANLDLSQRRAAAVVAYLVKAGTEPERLAPHGYGQTRPMADNKTAAGREKNRRVVFTILDPAPLKPASDSLEIPDVPANSAKSAKPAKPGKKGAK